MDSALQLLQTVLNGIIAILTTLSKFDITAVNENSMANLANYISPFVKALESLAPTVLPKILEMLQ